MNSKRSEEKILGGLIAQKASIMSRYGVFFTETRILFARTGFSPFMLLLFIASIPVSFLLGGYMFLTYTDNPIVLLFFAVLWAVFLGTAVIARLWIGRSRYKFRKLSKLSPEIILAMDKKNFQILYNDILRVEMQKKGSFRLSKMIIQTRNEKHEFNLIERFEKEKYDSQLNLVRSLLPEKTYVV